MATLFVMLTLLAMVAISPVILPSFSSVEINCAETIATPRASPASLHAVMLAINAVRMILK